MSAADLTQLVGIISLLGMAVVFTVIAWDDKRFSKYGREALSAAACFVVATSLVRFLFLVNAIGLDMARGLNGIASVVFFVIALQAFVVQRVEVHSNKRTRDRIVRRLASKH